MRILATVFCYNRPVVLRHCLDSIFANTVRPDEIHLIDDGSNAETAKVIDEAITRYSSGPSQIVLTRKRHNRGASHSGRMALAYARSENPQYWFPIEADYIFKPTAFETVLRVMEDTEAGKVAFGVVGYDHPGFYNQHWRDNIFPQGMVAQVGEDNVHRSALYRTSAWSEMNRMLPHPTICCFELASNTCPTCYLNWRRIREVEEEFPEFTRLLSEVMDPQENPNYPDSGKYRKGNIIDDGMLSHAINLVWNRWAIRHGIDRDKFAGWLNIKPSVAQNITGGGNHASNLAEMQTDGGSPTWIP